MNQAPQNSSAARTRTALWPAMIFILLGSNMLIVGVTVFAALHYKAAIVDRSFDVSALQWDQTKARQEHQSRVGWTCDVQVSEAGGNGIVQASLRDATGEPIRNADVRVECFHNAHASEPISLKLAPTENGYAAGLSGMRPGLWTLHVAAKASGESAEFNVERESLPTGATTPTPKGAPTP